MTRFTTLRPETEAARETRTPVRLIDRPSSAIFPGWGPKL